MKQITYICDRCGHKIPDVVYTLSCYADGLDARPFGGNSAEVAAQNSAQNRAKQRAKRHLCKSCKDAITDGLFIV